MINPLIIWKHLSFRDLEITHGFLKLTNDLGWRDCPVTHMDYKALTLDVCKALVIGPHLQLSAFLPVAGQLQCSLITVGIGDLI